MTQKSSWERATRATRTTRAQVRLATDSIIQLEEGHRLRSTSCPVCRVQLAVGTYGLKARNENGQKGQNCRSKVQHLRTRCAQIVELECDMLFITQRMGSEEEEAHARIVWTLLELLEQQVFVLL